ncbi:hypothetical protein HanIR_Chr10g0493951 [Helianthus annuus]|nr:hypothetical protein HanIR_Chr10g0493951 [Helianthus annuus]
MFKIRGFVDTGVYVRLSNMVSRCGYDPMSNCNATFRIFRCISNCLVICISFHICNPKL